MARICAQSVSNGMSCMADPPACRPVRGRHLPFLKGITVKHPCSRSGEESPRCSTGSRYLPSPPPPLPPGPSTPRRTAGRGPASEHRACRHPPATARGDNRRFHRNLSASMQQGRWPCAPRDRRGHARLAQRQTPSRSSWKCCAGSRRQRAHSRAPPHLRLGARHPAHEQSGDNMGGTCEMTRFQLPALGVAASGMRAQAGPACAHVSEKHRQRRQHPATGARSCSSSCSAAPTPTPRLLWAGVRTGPRHPRRKARCARFS